MNWLVFAVVAWLALGLETGLKELLAVQIGRLWVSPSFVVPLAVFVAMAAPPNHALWACLLLGLMLDLTAPVVTGHGPDLTVAGPFALGLFVAGQYVLAIRGLMIRRNPLSLVFLAITGAAVMHVVVVAIFTVRGLYGGAPAGWQAWAELVERFGSSVYTGLVALAMALLLLPMSGWFGFGAGPSRTIPRRAYERR